VMELGTETILFKYESASQCCGAGAESRGAEIELPPGAGAEIT
jgi:hypothetical protein